MYTVEIINKVIVYLFFLCYAYQFVYLAVGLLARKRQRAARSPSHRIAVLIAARNEEAVIGQLLDSLAQQDYPQELVDVYVGADNCTDRTADLARAHGATVFERFDSRHVGKGYVLSFLLRRIALVAEAPYDAYLVLDADNVLAPDYLRAIEARFAQGYEIVTSYRNSKNYGDNWISAGYALWFLRESRYLNGARMALGCSCAVSGTGFLFSRRVLERCDGWNYFLLTEDIEFTVDNIIAGETIGYAADAVLYDEQPTEFAQSWRQRLRWSRGYLQVFRKHGLGLLRGIARGSFSCYDMAMNIMPAAVLTGLSVAVNLAASIWGFVSGGALAALGASVLRTAASLYLTVFFLGAVTTVTEWRNILCPWWKKLLYAFTFPLFMMTYIPICIASLFTGTEWKPIRHCRSLSLQEVRMGAVSRTPIRRR